MSFIVAGIIFALTLGLAIIQMFAAGMSDSPSASADVISGVRPTFIIGTVLALAVAATHWLPHIGW